MLDRVADHAQQFLHQQRVLGKLREVLQQAAARIGIAVFGLHARHPLERFHHLARRDHLPHHRHRPALVVGGIR